MRATVVAMALLLAFPMALGAGPTNNWDDVSGNAQRTGAAFLPTATLDVLGSSDLGFGDDLIISLSRAKGLVATPHGLVGLAINGAGDCIHILVNESGPEQRLLDQCVAATMEGYDRTNDRIFACAEGGGEDFVFQSRDAATGTFAWGIRPEEVSPSENLSWDCNGSALDSDANSVYVVLFAMACGSVPGVAGTCNPSPVYSALIRLRADNGEIEWVAPISVQAFHASVSQEVGPYDNQGAGFRPTGISLSDGGVVVSGRTTCYCDKTSVSATPIYEQGAVVWFRALDGALLGRAQAEDDFTGDGIHDRRLGQWWAPTQGPLAAFALGDRVMVVNYAEREPIREAPFEGIETGAGFIGVVPSAWWDDTLLVPLGESVTAVDSQSLETQWSWTKADGWRVSSMLVVPPRDVWVLLSKDPDEPAFTAASMHRLDLITGDEVQRLDIPGAILNSGGLGRARFQPMDDGHLLVYSRNGQIFEFGPSAVDAMPAVDVSDDYPAVVGPTTISVSEPRAAATYSIAWGDGQLETGGTSWTHRYGAPGDHVARITETRADGTTSTFEQVVHVGMARPPDLNPLQRAFADENQDFTFGVLGIAVTLLGALLALFLRRRRHNYLQAELDRLRAITEESRVAPAGAALGLSTFRQDMEARLKMHKLSDGQFNLIEARAGTVAEAIRLRILGPAASKLTTAFHNALDLVLLDGRFDSSEVKGLFTILEKEKHLTAKEQADLRHTLGGLVQSTGQ